jgi:hypothetical protein
MNPPLRLVSDDVSARTEGATGDFIPGDAPRPALPHLESSALIEPGHLTRCPQCGEMNGKSADTCWNCEIDLQTVGPRGLVPSAAPVAASAHDSPTATAPDHEAWHDLGLDLHLPQSALADAGSDSAMPPDDAYWSLPVLTSSIAPNELALTHAHHDQSVPGSGESRWPAGVKAVVAGVLVLFAACAYLYFDGMTPNAADSSPAAARDGGFSRAPGSTVSKVSPAADPPGGDLAHVDAALRTAERLVAQPGPAVNVVPTKVAPAEPVVETPSWPRVAQNHRGSSKARGSSRAAIAPATAVAPEPEPPRPIQRATVPAAPIGPCTPNVAALGLCAAPSSQPKE